MKKGGSCRKKGEPSYLHLEEEQEVTSPAPPSPIPIDDDEEEEEEDEEEELRPVLKEGYYEVEEIRGRRIRKGQLQYFIKWRDWVESANTWEPVHHMMEACSDMILDFEQKRTKLTRGRKKGKRKRNIPPNQPKKKKNQPSPMPPLQQQPTSIAPAATQPIQAPTPTRPIPAPTPAQPIQGPLHRSSLPPSHLPPLDGPVAAKELQTPIQQQRSTPIAPPATQPVQGPLYNSSIPVHCRPPLDGPVASKAVGSTDAIRRHSAVENGFANFMRFKQPLPQLQCPTSIAHPPTQPILVPLPTSIASVTTQPIQGPLPTSIAPVATQPIQGPLPTSIAPVATQPIQGPLYHSSLAARLPSPLDEPVEGKAVGSTYVFRGHPAVDNGFANILLGKCQKKETNDNQTQLTEHRGLQPNGLPAANIPPQAPETKSSENDGAPNEQSKENVSPTNRFVGAKRRKSGRVKRFKPAAVPREALGSDALESLGENVPVNLGNSVNPPSIVKIISPLEYNTAVFNNKHDVSVTFRVLRSDGRETRVDNNYLKVNNPQLLISFYEQHLRAASHV